MSQPSDWEFPRENILGMLNTAYELEDDATEIQVQFSDGLIDDAERELQEASLAERDQELKILFQKLADRLYTAGAFSSKEEARRVITKNADDRAGHLGPDGIVPDDGQLTPDEEADGILALLNNKEFSFSAPICRVLGYEQHEMLGALEIRIETDDAKALITTRLADVRHSAELTSLPDPASKLSGMSDRWLWITGTAIGRTSRQIQRQIEDLIQEVQGALLVFELARYRANSFEAPPETVIGRNSRFNMGVNIYSRATRCAPQLLLQPKISPKGELDIRRGREGILEQKIRKIERLLQNTTPNSKPIRHACRMFLRSFDSWVDGEKAMLLSTTLEGLLLDKKNREDLSARLQDAVGFLLGRTHESRAELRNSMRDTYKLRSSYVHSGATSERNFDIERAVDLVRQIIVKEISLLT